MRVPVKKTAQGSFGIVVGMKRETRRSKPFLKWQRQLSAMFEPEKVAHFFRSTEHLVRELGQTDAEIENQTHIFNYEANTLTESLPDK